MLIVLSLQCVCSRKNVIILRTQLAVRVQVCIGKHSCSAPFTIVEGQQKCLLKARSFSGRTTSSVCNVFFCIIPSAVGNSPYTHTHICLTALFPGQPRWAGTRKVKPIWILLKEETVSGSGISWAICKSALRSRQITMPAPHHSVFYRTDALPATDTTASKH